MNPVQGSNRLLLPKATRTWAEIFDSAALHSESDDLKSRRTIFAVADNSEALSALAFGMHWQLDFGIVEASRLEGALPVYLREHGWRIARMKDGTVQPLSDGGAADTVVDQGRISVFTSGTTGTPKVIPHTADTLNTFARVRQPGANRWFLPYQIGSYAWYQLAFLSLFVAGQDLVPADLTDRMGSFEAGVLSGNITAISSTPTFWRQAFLSLGEEVLAKTSLRLISLGGEIVDQAILDKLRRLFPEASIRHIYASSEAGAAIVVSDGKAGFDAGLLDAGAATVSLRIADGRLHVRSRYGSTGIGGDWIDTGDLVEQSEGRVLFRGRADNQMINVGGQKAYPASVESHLLSHPDVVWARVEARRAPIVGYLPSARVVMSVPMDHVQAERILTEFCAAHLAEYEVPRFWDFLQCVPEQPSLKS